MSTKDMLLSLVTVGVATLATSASAAVVFDDQLTGTDPGGAAVWNGTPLTDTTGLVTPPVVGDNGNFWQAINGSGTLNFNTTGSGAVTGSVKNAVVGAAYNYTEGTTANSIITFSTRLSARNNGAANYLQANLAAGLSNSPGANFGPFLFVTGGSGATAGTISLYMGGFAAGNLLQSTAANVMGEGFNILSYTYDTSNGNYEVFRNSTSLFSGTYTGSFVPTFDYVGLQSRGSGTNTTGGQFDWVKVDITAIPEPGSIALAAIGGVMLLSRRRSR